jgi:NAD(P)-dependent dehydrogenase (short-subunit alcohol dehydrogenase family)
MKNVVITGSARGFGYAMLKLFYQDGYNVVMIDMNEEALKQSKQEIEKTNVQDENKVLTYKCDITNSDEVKVLIDDVVSKLGSIDIWINNAGVNQEMLPIWELEIADIARLIDIDLKGTINCSNLVMKQMEKQNSGQIYNVEGFGSDDAKQFGLSIYGTAKRAVTYFTEALAFEVDEKKLNIQVGKITPGIMITNFINHSLGDKKEFELSDKVKMVYNILGDRPETIAEFMVKKIEKNTKNDVKLTWLTKKRAFGRFMKAPFKKNNYFLEEGRGE